jgi:hypothetical protein
MSINRLIFRTNAALIGIVVLLGGALIGTKLQEARAQDAGRPATCEATITNATPCGAGYQNLGLPIPT